MIRILSVLSFFFLFNLGYSQDLVLIKFTDKPNAEYYFSNPLEMLSQKALDRREKYNIPLDILDIPVNEDYVNGIIQLGIEPAVVSRWFNGVFAWCTEEEIDDAGDLAFVADVESFVGEPVGTGKTGNPDKFIEPVYPAYAQDGISEMNYGYTESQITQLNLDFLHDLGFTGDGITIGVLDNGFVGVDEKAGFAYLRENGQIKGVYNFVDNNEDVYTRGDHGTSVLSTMGGYIEDSFVGTAIDADYYLFITENNDHEMPDEEINWIAAAEKADSIGIDVINTSLGYSEFDDSRYDYAYEDMDGQTTYISRGAQFAAEKGIMIVVSAGNSGNKNWHYITAPADAADVFTIGAVDSDGFPAGFSSYGPTSDGRIKPDVAARGVEAAIISSSGNINFSSGTSFSSPIMAGAMACLIQAFPEYQPADLRQKVRETASHHENPTDQMGYGIPNFSEAYGACLGTEEVDRLPEVTVYPNPVNDVLRIDSKTEIEQLQIISIEGKIVRKYQFADSVNVSDLPSGIYILKTYLSNGRIEVNKFIKR